MSQECPLCFSRVHIGGDGRCPACRGDTRAAGADPRWTAVTVRAGHGLPCCCIVCGTDTRRAKTFRFRARRGHVPQGLLDRLATLGAAPALFSLLVFKPWVSFRRALPLCEDCAAAGAAPRPLLVLPEQEAVRLRVHVEFRRRFEEINPEAASG